MSNALRLQLSVLAVGAALACGMCGRGSGGSQPAGSGAAGGSAGGLGFGGAIAAGGAGGAGGMTSSSSRAGSGGAGGTATWSGAGGDRRDASQADSAEAGPSDRCQAASLVWHTGAKTNYTSYPDPDSEECIKYSGCEYEGLFSACPSKKSLDWVKAHNIVSVFPDFDALKLHDLCLRSGTKTIVVTVLDECADSDCSGCCTENQGRADQLIDIESFTDARWGIEDGPIEWADLGATKGSGCQ